MNRAAKETGLSDATPTKWKKTGATPDTATLAKLSKYFDVPISYLLGDTDDPTDRSKTHWAEIVQDDIPEDAIKAAFFKGADMTKEEMDAAWQDAKDYIAFKSEQRRRGGGK